MKPFFTMLLTLAVCAVATAQEGCPEYRRLIQEATTYSGEGNYRLALYKFNTAKTCSPARRAEVDSLINLLFEKIESERKKALAAEGKYRDILVKMQQTDLHEHSMELAKNNADSLRFTDKFISDNHDWLDNSPSVDTRTLMADVVTFNKADRSAVADSLSTFFRALRYAKVAMDAYHEWLEINTTSLGTDKFPSNKKGKTVYYRFRGQEFSYNSTLERLDQAAEFLPAATGERYYQQIGRARRELAEERENALRGYWMPDTLIGLPATTRFTINSADNRNLLWGYSDFADFRKVKMHYFSLSLPDFTLTTDSLLDLPDTGKFFTVYASTGNYGVYVGRQIDYSLKKNKAEYRTWELSVPVVKGLMTDRGAVLADLSADSSTAYFLTPDGGHLAFWKKDDELQLFDTKNRKYIPLPNAKQALTMSLSSNSRSIAYYNTATKTIYLSDLDGHPIGQIPGAETRINAISNIDYTGGDAFLVVNNDDTISLFDLRNRKPILSFDKGFVSSIVVSPNKNDILVSCNTVYRSGTDTFYGTASVLIDSLLNIKTKLYSGSYRYFFTPDGAYLIGIGDRAVSRWTVGGVTKPAPQQSCLSFEELVEYKYFPFSALRSIDDAAKIQKAAYALKDMAQDEKDGRLKSLLLRQARSLFDRLAYGNAKNIRRERVPIYYDWYTWADRQLGNRNFRDQFIRQQAAVKLEENLVNSPDSVYPEQLENAAYSYGLMASLYDSLGAYNNDYVYQLLKSIALRHRVLLMDPDDHDNIGYYRGTVKQLGVVCDSVGWVDLLGDQYTERLELFRKETTLLGDRVAAVPDTVGMKDYYIRALAQFSASYLYVYVNRPADYAAAADSALLLADKGLALMPNQYDSARFLLVKARAWLLKPGEVERALAIYRQLKGWSDVISVTAMLKQLDNLRTAGARKEEEFRRVEEILKR